MNVFRNALDESVRFRIEPRIGEGGIYLELKENGNRATTVFPPEDAPALALAILEATGVEATDMPEDPTHWNDPEALESFASWCLRQSIELKARATAEAKEREELEAEALELFNAWTGTTKYTSWNEVAVFPDGDKREWLAVARKARELAKGAGE